MKIVLFNEGSVPTIYVFSVCNDKGMIDVSRIKYFAKLLVDGYLSAECDYKQLF